MYFPAEHLLNKLEISDAQLRDFEEKGIVQGISKAGRVFYSSRDMYRLKGILLLPSRCLSLDETKWHVDDPTQEVASAGRDKQGCAVPVRSTLELWREGPINRYLLCSVLSKQTRRLGPSR